MMPASKTKERVTAYVLAKCIYNFQQLANIFPYNSFQPCWEKQQWARGNCTLTWKY
jgi:hypothetical protein